jgi:class 3 adenylate cyclase/nitrite reductase/ring-hydroxylating ferredoxin subunit
MPRSVVRSAGDSTWQTFGGPVARVTSLPDNLEFDVTGDETLLEAALRSDIAFAHACGGRAKCSTCRVWVLEGLEACRERNELESAMADRLGLAQEVRLACQLKPQGRLRIRRLVIDETDLMMCSQLDRTVAARAGEAKKVTIFFSDVANFTSIAERLSAYDVMYLLNRYFVQVGDIIERNGGFIDKFVGDGLMSVFGVDDQPDAPLRSVRAALQTLEAVDRMKPFFASMYEADFDIRIGLHYGEAVLGSLGSIGHERLTAIGDVVNVASRVEIANKDAGTRLLISSALHEQVKEAVEVVDFVRVRLRGTSERMTLYEIGALTPEAEAQLNKKEQQETRFFAGKKWMRAFAVDTLAVDEHRVLRFEDFDVVIVRSTDSFFAFNNACPHLHLPLFETRDLEEGAIGCFPGTNTPRPLHSTFVENRGLVCRWHHSCFDLQTGDVRDWATRLAADGTSPGWEFLGDVSRNRMRLKVYPCHVEDGDLWIAVE